MPQAPPWTQDFGSLGGGDPLAADFGSVASSGLLATLIRETARDIYGAGRTAVAPVGSLLNLLGANVPISIEDLTSRDLRGALMTAALVASGGAGAAARGLPLFGALATRGAAAGGRGAVAALSRAGATATAEAVAGAAFGLVRPLEEDEERLRAVIGDAAWFGAFGAGASFAKTATKATFGGFVSRLKAQASRAHLARAAHMIQQETAAREVLGVKLLNPDLPGASIGIRRQADGRVTLTRYDGRKKALTERYNDFGAAAARAVEEGFSEAAGPFRASRLQRALDELDQATLDLITGGGEREVSEALGLARLNEYAAVREAARANAEKWAHLTHLVAEDLTEQVGELGAVELIASTRQMLMRQLAGKTQDLAKLSDAELVRQGVLQGVVDIQGLAEGARTRDWLRELTLNGVLPEGTGVVVASNADGIFTSLLTPRTIGRLHPEVAPLEALADRATYANERGAEAFGQWLHELRGRVSPEAAEIATKIIDQSADVEGDLYAAIQAARQASQATGDFAVHDFVENATAKLHEYMLRLVAAGRLGELDDAGRSVIDNLLTQAGGDPHRLLGLVTPEIRALVGEAGLKGYFPIVNANKWKLDIKGASALPPDFTGFYPTREEALAAWQKILADNPRASATIVPSSFTFGGAETTLMEPRQFATMIRAMQAVAREDLSRREIREIAGEAAAVAGSRAPRKASPFLQERRLGIRDFSREPFEALQIYGNSMERVLAFNTFERDALAIIEQIPQAKAGLRTWAEQYVDRVLGRPTWSERFADTVAERLGLDLQPRTLRRATSVIRRFESMFRLGNFFSPMVNMTQIAVNTYPVLGAKYTVKGLELLTSKTKFQQAKKLFAEHGLDLGIYVPLTEAGEVAAFTGLSGAFERFKREKGGAKAREAGEMLYQSVMWLFNGAERINRYTTAWGAYHKHLAEHPGATKAAVEYARQIVERTQFVYRTSNTPQVLHDPLLGTLFQFKSFFVNQMEFLATLRGPELARLAVSLQALGGASLLFNMPVTSWLDSATGLFMDEKLSEKATLAADGALSRATIFGMPGLFGVDISDYVGIGSLRDITTNLFGPAVTDLRSLYQFAREGVADIAAHGRVSDETQRAFLQRTMPSAVRRIQRAADIVASGETRNAYSRKLIYRPRDRYRTALMTALGPPEIDAQQERLMDEITTRVRERFVRARSSAAKEAAEAAIRGDDEGVRQAMAEAAASGIPLDAETVRRYARELQRPAAERRLRRTPTALRSEMLDFFDLTGSTEFGVLP